MTKFAIRVLKQKLLGWGMTSVVDILRTSGLSVLLYVKAFFMFSQPSAKLGAWLSQWLTFGPMSRWYKGLLNRGARSNSAYCWTARFSGKYRYFKRILDR